MMIKCVALAALVAPAMSATPACARQGFGYVDPNVRLLDGGLPLDAQGCQDLCSASLICQVFTYYENSHACWLQGGGLTAQEIPDAVSGPKSCPTLQAAAPEASQDAVGTNAADTTTTAADTTTAAAESAAEATPEPEKELDMRKVGAAITAGIVVVGLVCVCCCQGKEDKAKKPKTRGLKLKDEKPAPAPAPEVEAPLIQQMQPVPTVAAPMPMYTSYSVAPPVYTSNVMYSQAPVATYSQAPMATYSQLAPQVMYPPQYTYSPTSQTMPQFMDANGDGVVTRAEFNAAMAAQQAFPAQPAP